MLGKLNFSSSASNTIIPLGKINGNSEVDKFAARELQTFVEKMTKVKLPIAETASGKPLRTWANPFRGLRKGLDAGRSAEGQDEDKQSGTQP